MFLSPLLLGGWTAMAQTGTVVGRVTDASGSVVVNARVALVSAHTGKAWHVSTGEGGGYHFAEVPAELYSLTVDAIGFATFQQRQVTVGSGAVSVDVRLQLQSASQTVTVTGDQSSLQQVPSVGKTGTIVEDMPGSVQLISRNLANSQGDLSLAQTVRNSPGIIQGGTDGFGFGDRFQIRGLEARIYNDGFSDGDERNGIPHSLNGVERIEVLEGPGSALFGSGPPGGTINVVHFLPSPTFSSGGTFQTGSFQLFSGNAYVTGATPLRGVAYRVDGLAQHEEGFRSLSSADYELRPSLSWTFGNHMATLVVDGRELRATPDVSGLIYLNHAPIKAVTREAKYSTPFSVGDQALVRATASDIWAATPHLTFTNRFSFMYRNLPILRNGDSGTVTGIVFSGRQLRRQHDVLNDFDYEAEPVWNFKTGKVRHALLTGFEAQHQSIGDNRATADLPNIVNIFDPVVPETSTNGLVFLQDAKHSGFHDDLSATYYGLYATDQIDLTQKLKVRVGGRQDWWSTQLKPLVFVPGRIFTGTESIEPPNTYSRFDTPFSWNAGAVYRVHRDISPYFGVAKSNLVNFTSEATQNGVQAPENGLQYEAGVKAAALDRKLMFTVAGFDVKRNNVFTLVGDVPVFNDQKTNGGEATVELALAHRWKLSANGTAEHAWLTDNPSQPAATGKRPVGVPQHIFNLWTTYELKVAGITGFTVGGGLTNRDRMYGDLLNTNAIPAYTTLDAVVTYTGAKWNSSLGFRNLTNTRYFTAANGAGGFVGEPLSVFFAARRSFGGGRN